MKQEIIKKTLLNGLRTVFVKNKKNKVVIEVGVKVGLVDETQETNGISHFLEHVLWEGTNSETGKEIRNKVRKMNGEYNAGTGAESTTFYIQVPRRHFDEALELIAGVITRPSFNEEEINKEKKVILNEMTRYSDYPFYSIDHKATKELFEGNMLQNDLIGTAENINRINKNLLELHYAKYYAPNNMVVLVNGNIDDPTQKIEKLFNIQPKFIPEPNKFKLNSVLPKEITEKADTKASYVELAFLTAGYKEKESDALEIIEELFEDGKELSLMEEIRFKHGLTYHVHIMQQSLKETGMFVVGLSTENNKTQEAITLIKNQINKIQHVTKSELEKAKKRMFKKFKEIIKDQEVNSRLMTHCELTDTWNDYHNYNKIINAITIEDIKNTAKKYLSNNYVQVILEQKEVNANESI